MEKKSLLSLRKISLVTLALQNSFLILLMRYSVTLEGPIYLASTAVFLSELFKLIICVAVFVHESRQNEKKISIWEMFVLLFGKETESWKLAIPALLYTIQNNLQYFAVSKLDAATFQVTYQLKVLATALFSVLLLGKRLSLYQWASLVMLTIGVALIQFPTNSSRDESNVETSSSQRFVGLIAVLSACCLSGLAGVYFEKVLKKPTLSLDNAKPPPSIWVRNIQLAFYSVLLVAIFGVYGKDGDKIREYGFWRGYSFVTFLVIVTQAAGGLLVAMVVKYADNILKGFATSISIILSCIVSIFLFDFQITWIFATGSMFVIYSTFLYEYQPTKKTFASTKQARLNLCLNDIVTTKS